MGVDIVIYRCRIGCFVQPCKSKSRFATINLSLTKLSLCVRLVLFLLLCVQCIEPNPGPVNRGSTNRGSVSRGACGRGSPAGRGSNRSTNKNRGYTPDPVRNTGNADTTPRGLNSTYSPVQNISYSQAVRSPPRTRATQRQQDLNAWLNDPVPNRAQSPERGLSQNQSEHNNSVSSSASTVFDLQGEFNREHTVDTDTKSLLLEIRGDVKNMNRKFDRLEESVFSLQKENEALKKSNDNLTKEVKCLSETVETVRSLANEAKMKNERLEAQSRRDNLKFFGLKEDSGETWEQTEAKVRDEIRDLGMDESSISVERAHRLPSAVQPRPVIVKFSFFKDRESVMKAYRQRRKNGSPNVRIVEDFPERVTRQRTALYPLLRESLRQNKSAFYRYDKLIVDGASYCYDFEAKCPVQVER